MEGADGARERDLHIIDFVSKHLQLVGEGTSSLMQKDALWKQLAAEINCDSFFVKTRWTNIQHAYKTNLRKRRSVKYKYHDYLTSWFPLDVTTQLHVYSSETEAATTELNNGSETKGEEDEEVEVDAFSNPLDEIALAVEVEEEQVPTQGHSTRRSIKRIRATAAEQEEEDVELEEVDEPDDPLRTFFDAMYASTKRLKPRHVQRVRREIFDLIHQLESEELLLNGE